MHGFRRHRSTQTALLSMYNKWITSASEDRLTGAILLDLSAAFDLVSHDMLLKKLKIHGLDNGYMVWLKSYLEDRYQSVWIDHVFSSYLHCPIGVPQGSILGPLLFIIYFNDFLSHIGCTADSYADDTTLSVDGKSLGEISQKLNVVCDKVVHWMNSNMLKLNPTKTHVMTIGTEQRLRNLHEKLEVSMDGILLVEDNDHVENYLDVKCNQT